MCALVHLVGLRSTTFAQQGHFNSMLSEMHLFSFSLQLFHLHSCDTLRSESHVNIHNIPYSLHSLYCYQLLCEFFANLLIEFWIHGLAGAHTFGSNAQRCTVYINKPTHHSFVDNLAVENRCNSVSRRAVNVIMVCPLVPKAFNFQVEVWTHSPGFSSQVFTQL